MRRLLAAAGAALLVTLTAGCGVPNSSDPVIVDSGAVPYRLLEGAPTPTASGTTMVGPTTEFQPQLWFVTPEGRLRAIPGDVAGPSTGEALGQLLTALVAGPDQQQRDLGLSTLFFPDAVLTVESLNGGRAQISVRLGDHPPTPGDLPVATAQIVLTATSLPDVTSVVLLSDGTPATVLPDGRLVDQPVIADDYASLREPPG